MPLALQFALTMDAAAQRYQLAQLKLEGSLPRAGKAALALRLSQGHTWGRRELALLGGAGALLPGAAFAFKADGAALYPSTAAFIKGFVDRRELARQFR